MKKFNNYLVLIILILYFLSSADTQQRGRQTGTNKKKKGKKIKPTFTIKKHMKTSDEEEKKQIQCLVCNAEFVMKDFNEVNRCYNPGLNATDTKNFLISTCPIETKFCITEVLRIHGVFAAINRKCGGVFCVEACFQRSFGIERETCTFCCEGIQPYHFQQVGEDLIAYEVSSNEIDSNSIAQNRSLSSKEVKELKRRIQNEQMKTAYNCPPFYKSEY